MESSIMNSLDLTAKMNGVKNYTKRLKRDLTVNEWCHDCKYFIVGKEVDDCRCMLTKGIPVQKFLLGWSNCSKYETMKKEEHN